jgi:hypothetical protein
MNGKLVGLIAAMLTVNNISGQNCINCSNASNTGLNSSAVGYNAIASGDYSLAFGFNSFSGGLRSIALGNLATATAGAGFAIGNMVSATSLNAFTLGTGYSSTLPLINSNPNSLAIGFNSNVPTLFIGMASGQGTYGNVGIGTTNPSQRLSVNGIIESLNGGFKFPDGTIQTSKAYAPWHGNANNAIFYINGNVGIGLKDPIAPLDVYGDIVLGKPGENFILHSRSWIGDALVIAPQNNNGGWDWTKSICLKDNGQVFIGGDLSVTSPHAGYRLAVNGKTISKEVIVTIQHWADFVFDSEYQLTELSELQKYISENHHLPGVPTQDEVLENGIPLGEMNKILLTKVEELTLYAINLQKQIDELSKLALHQSK